ncbi:MAG: site-2 protease family protein, partial [Leptolyngbyaceae cyanobacterium bins.59]|nr:site-2 protease family protein [Leptolyngbyaceae cyanobacterium bins.59]
MITTLVLFVALGILIWGFVRARPYGKLGILAWLQSAVLIAPWLLFFGLSTIGIFLNLVGILFLFVLSTGVYIFLGNRLRAEGQSAMMAQRSVPSTEANSTPPETASANHSSDPTQSTPPHPPSPAAPKIISPVEVAMPKEDLTAVQGIFGIDTFFATETIPYQEGAIFKGNLRGDAETSHARLSASLKERLNDRYRLFLVE